MREASALRNLALLSSVFLTLGGQPAAADEGFKLRFDPVILQSLEVDVDTDSSKFNEYRDIRSGFQLPQLHIAGESADGERTLVFRAQHALREDARYTLEYDLAGKYELSFDYNKIPHRFGNRGTFLWTATSPGLLTLADPVQQQLQRAIEDRFATNRAGITYSFLSGLIAPHLATAERIDPGLQRDRSRLRFAYGQLTRLRWGVEYNHENRSGTRPFGGAFGFGNVLELVEPVEYDTSDLALSGEWNGKKGGLRFGYTYSTFENDHSTLIWDNPFRATDSTSANAYQGPGTASIDGPSQGRTDLAPDNEASSFFLGGRAKLGSGWWLQGNLTYNQLTQDDPLLPYTINHAILGINPHTGATFDATDAATLPVRSADEEAAILSLAASAGTRFAEDWSFTLRYRYYDYDKKSRSIEFPGYVRFDAVWEEIPRRTVPYSYTRDNLGLELAWEATRKTTLTLSYDLQSWDRELREIENSDDDILKFSLDTRPNDKILLRASWERGDRSISDYHVEAQELSFVEPEGINNQPGLRKFDEAAREYDDYKTSAQFFFGEAWNLTVGVAGRDEDYPESQFGLISDEILQYNFDLAYSPGEDLNFYLFGHTADRESFQRARQSGGTVSTNPADDWTADLDETVDTLGLGLTAKAKERWDFDLTANWSKSDGSADFESPPGGNPAVTVDFANYEDIELLAFLAHIEYAFNARIALGFHYRYEDYTINSFNLQGLIPYLPSTLLLVANDGDYQANVFGLSLRFTN